MSTYFRKVIARRIVNIVNKKIQQDLQNEETLVKCVTKYVKLRQVSKRIDVKEPQYWVKLFNENLKDIDEQYQNHFETVTKDDLSEQDSSDDLVLKFEGEENSVAIGVKLDSSVLNKYTLNKVWKERENYGYIPLRQENDVKSIVVEYSSPNIAKRFHVGHLRSTIIGNIIANLYEAAGHKVTRINYLGDWGTQFGLLCHAYEKYGNEKELEENPLPYLNSLYVRINKEVKHDKTQLREGLKKFKMMTEGSEAELSLWKKFRDLSIEEYNKIYKQLGIEFTAVECESMYDDKIQPLLERLKEEGLLQTGETGNSYVEVDTTSDPMSSKAVMVKSDGSSLYLTRDIAAILDRYERYKFDQIHYVVEGSQFVHFERLFGVLKKLNLSWPCLSDLEDFHVRYGRVIGMSTRKGQSVFLEAVIEEAKTLVLQSTENRETSKEVDDAEEVAQTLGITGIIIQDVFSKRKLDYKFNWKKMINFNSNSGIFLQYAHARVCSLLRMNSNINVDEVVELSDDIINHLNEPEAHRLILHICGYEDAFQQALNTKEPCYITNYLFSLAHLINACHYTLKIKNQDEELAKARLLLFVCAKITLSNGLKLLGIKPLERM